MQFFLVVQHETLAKWQLDTAGENIKRVGIVVGISDIKDILPIKTCVANVVEGMPRDILVHMHVILEDQNSIPQIRGMLGKLPLAELKVETWHRFVNKTLDSLAKYWNWHVGKSNFTMF